MIEQDDIGLKLHLCLWNQINFRLQAYACIRKSIGLFSGLEIVPRTLFYDIYAVAALFESFLRPKKKNHTERCGFLVDDIGLEPMTFRTSSGCSSQLS